jgi:cytochrome c556
MNKVVWRTAAVVLALGLGIGLCQHANGQKTKGKTRFAPTVTLMQGIMNPNCEALAAVLKGEGPKDNRGWNKVDLHATILNEMSYVVMDDGRCPDNVWKGAAEILRTCSIKIVASAQQKDVKAAQAAFKKLTSACAICHKAHRPEEE